MPKIKSQINDEATSQFTSMIDIVFLLLIFFILQPFKAPELKIASDLPKDSGNAAPSTPRQNITVVIRVDPQSEKHAIYTVDGRPVGKTRYNAGRKLPSILKSSSGGRTDTPVSIQAEAKVRFQYVLEALDACYQSGLPDVKWGAPDPTYKPQYMRGG